MPDVFVAALSGLSREMFEFGEGLFDWGEVWSAGREEEQSCPGNVTHCLARIKTRHRPISNVH